MNKSFFLIIIFGLLLCSSCRHRIGSEKQNNILDTIEIKKPVHDSLPKKDENVDLLLLFLLMSRND